MADEAPQKEDKSLPASQQRLAQAREKGQVVRSRDFSGAVVTFVGFALLMAAGPGQFNRAALWLADSLRNAANAGAWAEPQRAFINLSIQALLGNGLLLAAMLIAGIAGSLVIGGLVFSAVPFTPNFARLSPMQGLSKIWSVSGLLELFKSILKVLVLGGLAAYLCLDAREFWMKLVLQESQGAIAALVMRLTRDICWMAAGMGLIAAIDVPLQWWRHHQEMRMTRDEVKRESKENEGDPHVKGRIRQQQRAQARKRMMQAVPSADVIVTNPTHFSVAIRYREDEMTAPQVVAKGSDELAFRIRERAAEHHITIIESPALARALYWHAEVDQSIPPPLFNAVARVLAYLYCLNQAQGAAAQAAAAAGLQDLPVPPGWDAVDRVGAKQALLSTN